MVEERGLTLSHHKTKGEKIWYSFFWGVIAISVLIGVAIAKIKFELDKDDYEEE